MTSFETTLVIAGVGFLVFLLIVVMLFRSMMSWTLTWK